MSKNFKRIIAFDNDKHKYFEFSNFYPIELNINVKNNLTNKFENIKFNSIEQFYQSEKFNDNNNINQIYRKFIILANTPKKAHLLGKRKKFIYNWPLNNNSKYTIKYIVDKYKNLVNVRKDWNKIKNNILLKGLKIKFNDDKLKKLLLNTNNLVLVENSIGVWGMKNNKLGNALMIVRDNLNKNSNSN